MSIVMRLISVIVACNFGCDQSTTSPPHDVRDATSLDGAACPDDPSSGCPCDGSSPSINACCLGVGYGLVCEPTYNSNDEYEYRWSDFRDCGCIRGPPCEGYEVYEHCYMRGP